MSRFRQVAGDHVFAGRIDAGATIIIGPDIVGADPRVRPSSMRRRRIAVIIAMDFPKIFCL